MKKYNFSEDPMNTLVCIVEHCSSINEKYMKIIFKITKNIDKSNKRIGEIKEHRKCSDFSL